MKQLLILAALLGAAGYLGSKFYLHDKVSRNLDLVLEAARPAVDVQYEGVSSTLSGDLSIDGITVHMAGFADPVHIASVKLVTPGYFHLLDLASIGSGSGGELDIPDELGIAFEGIRVATDADFMRAVEEARRAEYGVQEVADPAASCVGTRGFSAGTLRQLGYRELVIDAGVGYRQVDGKLLIDVSTDVAEMYDLSMVLTFDSMPTPQTVMMGAFQPRLVAGRLEYVDRSLEERVMKLCTEVEKLPVETVIAARVDAFQAVGSANGIEFDEYVIDPYIEFLNGKDRFVITAEPIDPVNLLQIGLYKPSDVPALLNLRAEAI
ncbi:MAG TPA: hypothetical protein VFG91_07360 [Woeseiaceae bacterium]|nr:hypothetical protein [Woeseiaceae bacterium]